MTLATLVLGDINLSASTIIWWLVVGLIAGVLASFVMRGGYGIVGDIVIGIVGAFLGGFLASLLGIGASGLVGTIIIAFIGACILIALLRVVSRSYPRRRI
jgi:uncharacterized membrane protein YeaQ/YmgE (transglycosylase-associated protein family)